MEKSNTNKPKLSLINNAQPPSPPKPSVPPTLKAVPPPPPPSRKDFFNALFGDSQGYRVISAFGTKKSFDSYGPDELDIMLSDITIKSGMSDLYFNIGLSAEKPAPGKRGTEREVGYVTAFATDIDIAGDGHNDKRQYPQSKDEVKGILNIMPLAPSALIHTGGGYHVYYFLDVPFETNDEVARKAAKEMSKRVQTTIAQHAKLIDREIDSTADLAHLFRVPETYNYKLDKERLVNIIELHPDRRYSMEDFDANTVKFEKAKATHSNRTPSNPSEQNYPTAKYDSIPSRCGWMQECQDDAENTLETEWFAQLSIVARCEDGHDLAHELSLPHPEYSPAETDAKVEHALEYGPRTCMAITEEFAPDCCKDCLFKGHIKSPIELGSPSSLKQAKLNMIEVIADMSSNPQAIYSDKALDSLATIRRESLAQYASIRAQLKPMKVGVTELDKIVKDHALNLVEDMEKEEYSIENDMMYYERVSEAGGVTRTKLSTFAATINEEIVRDDGVIQRTAVRLAGTWKNGTALPSIVLSAEEFQGMNWMLPKYGVGAVCYPGQSNHLATAIQVLSNPTKTEIYQHTGWKLIDGDYHYLTSAGALGATGIKSNILVDLGTNKINLYDIPEVPPASHVDGIAASLRLLDLAPHVLTYPVLATVYRAILVEAMPVDFSLFIVGYTGAKKSELCGLMLGHYGTQFHAKQLTDTWSSTANSIEKNASCAKDALYAVDDFLTNGNSVETAKMNTLADRVFRSQGNLSGRQRMNADLSTCAAYSPRGLIVSTGEDVPIGQSLRARMLIVDIPPKAVKDDVLTQMQQERSQGLHMASMSGFIQWVAPRLKELKESLPAQFQQYRNEMKGLVTIHSRTPDIAASLMIGLEQFLAYACEMGAITPEEEAAHLSAGKKNIAIASSNQAHHQKSQCPVQTFFYNLEEAFQSGQCHLTMKDGTTPPYAENWGWRRKDPNNPACTDMLPQGKMVGWIDGTDVYLIPKASYDVSQASGGSAFRPIGVAEKTLQKHLSQQGKLRSSDPTTNTKRMSINSSRRRVLHVGVETLGFKSEESDSILNDLP